MTMRTALACLCITLLTYQISSAAETLRDQNLVTEYPYYNKDWGKGNLFFGAKPEEPGVGKWLYDKGVEYNGLAISAAFNNISTGARPGHVGAQMIFINALDLDLEKIADIHKAKIHIEGVVFPLTYPQSIHGDFGHFASSYLGSDQYPAHETDNPWLSLLTYEQTVWDDRLNFEFGKLNLQRYFFRPNCGLDFLCTDAVVKWDGGVPDASTGNLGARFRYNLTPQLSVEAGGQQLRDFGTMIKHNGWDFNATDHGTGTFLVGGLGYRTDFTQKAYPEDYQLHFYHADTDITDPYYSVNNTSVITTTDHAKSHRGSDGAVFKMQKILWSATGKTTDSPGKHPQSLSFFGTVAHTFDDARPIDWGLTGGLILEKPLGQRQEWFDIDQITFKTMYARLNDSTLFAQRDRRVLLGGSADMTSNNQYRVELSTTLSLGQYVKLQPAVEYIGNPDSSMSSDSPNLPRSGWLTGVVMAISFGNIRH